MVQERNEYKDNHLQKPTFSRLYITLKPFSKLIFQSHGHGVFGMVNGGFHWGVLNPDPAYCFIRFMYNAYTMYVKCKQFSFF